MRIFLQRFVVTMLFVVLCTDCNLRSEELDIGRFKQEATMGWQSIMDSYPGFEYSRHEQVVDQNIAPVKALMGSTRRTVTFRFLDRDFFRLDGTMEISKPDLDGITIPKMSSMSDFASLPLKVSKTTFSRIHNDRYDAAIDTTNGAQIGLLEQKDPDGNTKASRRDRRSAFPSLAFNNDSFLPTDLDWSVHSNQLDHALQKYRVKRVLRDESNGLVEISLIQGNTDDQYSVTLDPRRKWAIVRSKSVTPQYSQDRGYEYSSKEGFHPKKVTVKAIGRKNDLHIENVGFMELSELIPSDIDRSQCYMRSFGIPEPNFESKRSSFSVVLFCVLFAMCVGIGFLWKRKKNVKKR